MLRLSLCRLRDTGRRPGIALAAARHTLATANQSVATLPDIACLAPATGRRDAASRLRRVDARATGSATGPARQSEPGSSPIWPLRVFAPAARPEPGDSGCRPGRPRWNECTCGPGLPPRRRRESDRRSGNGSRPGAVGIRLFHAGKRRASGKATVEVRSFSSSASPLARSAGVLFAAFDWTSAKAN